MLSQERPLSTNVPPSIGPYVFQGSLGSGSFSVVKLAYNVNNCSYFACKIMSRREVEDNQMHAHFETEIRVLQQLHHPSVTRLVDLLQDDDNYYIFIEYCENGELFDLIVKEGPLKEQVAAQYARDILEGLDFLHSIGIAHRDLKPENVLIDKYGHIKISDFGLSKFVDMNGLTTTPCGSPCYASPECISGHPYDARCSDMWSLGVIVYSMVAGKLPWTNNSPAMIMKQIAKNQIRPPKGITAKCSNFISSLMAPLPYKRMTIQQAFVHPWLKSTIDTFKNEDSAFYIVSLKKVDMFFNAEIDISVDSMQSLEKSMSAENLLPNLKMRRRKRKRGRSCKVPKGTVAQQNQCQQNDKGPENEGKNDQIADKITDQNTDPITDKNEEKENKKKEKVEDENEADDEKKKKKKHRKHHKESSKKEKETTAKEVQSLLRRNTPPPLMEARFPKLFARIAIWG